MSPSSAPSSTRSTNNARISRSVEWVSIRRARCTLTHMTLSISPTSARCTGPNASARRTASSGSIGLAIQKRMCFVSTVRSLERRVFLPSSASGYSISPRNGPSATGTPVSSLTSRTAAWRWVSLSSSLPFGQLQSSYFGRCTMHTSSVSKSASRDAVDVCRPSSENFIHP